MQRDKELDPAGGGAPSSHQPAPALVARPSSPAFGFALSSEENGPGDLVRQAQYAETLGLDFLSISDHFHPWVPPQGNAPFVWSVLGGIASTTDRIVVGTGVTCPIIRMHPAIVAQAAATASVMFEGRFYLGVGAGEALNEGVVGDRWPSAHERLERLEEAIDIMRKLWAGETVNYDGAYYTVAEARLFTRPETPPQIGVASASPASARLASSQDALIATSPDADLVKKFEAAGGKAKPRLGQVTLCWDRDEAVARRTAREFWPTTVLSWAARSDIASPEIFADVTKTATEEDIAKNIPCGPNLDPIIQQVEEFSRAGFDHIYFHQVGKKQMEFLRVYSEELLPAVRTRLKELQPALAR
jgi:G6PDH family F420-dependent oxidoreductase